MQPPKLIDIHDQVIEYEFHRGSVPKTLVCCHPHPLYEGTMYNKVITTSTMAAKALDYSYLRFNYPGVGRSSGCFGFGFYEAKQARSLIDAVVQDQDIVLLGFSFGCSVIQQLLLQMTQKPPVIWVGASLIEALITPEITETVVGMVHGEEDALCPFLAAKALAIKTGIPLAGIEHAGHFFDGYQIELREKIKSYLSLC